MDGKTGETLCQPARKLRPLNACLLAATLGIVREHTQPRSHQRPPDLLHSLPTTHPDRVRPVDDLPTKVSPIHTTFGKRSNRWGRQTGYRAESYGYNTAFRNALSLSRGVARPTPWPSKAISPSSPIEFALSPMPLAAPVKPSYELRGKPRRHRDKWTRAMIVCPASVPSFPLTDWRQRHVAGIQFEGSGTTNKYGLWSVWA